MAPHPMRVVESHQTFTIRTMQRQRIVEAMRLRFARWNTADSEPDPMPGLRVDDQYLPVQLEQGVQRRIALHRLSLSHTDKDALKKNRFGSRERRAQTGQEWLK